MAQELSQKLIVLADAAKYDASCASSGAPQRSSKGRTGLGATNGTGICHSFTPDGRCVSLLKILLTNFCLYDCQYCINRRSSSVPRARFTPEEVVELTLSMYRRNTISGLFLSSGIIRSSDYTMEQLVRVARLLRHTHEFRGYIHLKTIPDASPELIREAGELADRLSVNIELPTDAGLTRLAPEKNVGSIHTAMNTIHQGVEAAAERGAPRFTPGGQSTQMIIGADDSDDHTILHRAQSLYGDFRLKRVYYSAFSPIPQSPNSVPLAPPPLMREHRLYQADFLMRGYGFRAEELLSSRRQLDLDIDPKLAWALDHREHFPVDLNRAEPMMMARVPGLGMTSVHRLIELRRERRIRYADVARLRCVLDRVTPFIVTQDYRPRGDGIESAALRQSLNTPRPSQLALW
ncbi:putative DNA modification/repair radical SAM protein [Kushneria phosphatilytica]|uniref:Putative DNA modification/repair radical SAM protein n=1 Tax=Kushneria phosphatilytica TaxID=657387 RepID=A0A1S1P1V4_9GAMM|nr:putative DNA modification/repair radical SAM protein [Kushneria phosphatilytica]OHV12780.1 putative DNA modification/repair radical SAM protein [Kushneria phosphatilytica]QEL10629.1 putative DNA modification/repair radical SAM protein [Kushneria phosphatilytica]